MKKAILQAIENKQFLYWQRRGLYGLELRTVSYTYENGNERTKLLSSFDLKSEIETIAGIHKEIKKLSTTPTDGDFRELLFRAWFDRSIDKHPSEVFAEEEYSHAN